MIFHILPITGDIMAHDLIVNVIFQVKWCYIIIMEVHTPSKLWIMASIPSIVMFLCPSCGSIHQ